MMHTKDKWVSDAEVPGVYARYSVLLCLRQSCYITQTGLKLTVSLPSHKLMILLSQPHNTWEAEAGESVSLRPDWST